MKFLQKIFFILPVLFLSGCFQFYNCEEDDLRTVPITNNPNIIPNYGGGMIPGMSPSKGPY